MNYEQPIPRSREAVSAHSGLRQVRASDFDFTSALGFQLADRGLKVTFSKPGVGTDRPQRARDDSFWLEPPRRRVGPHPIQDDRRPSNA